MRCRSTALHVLLGAALLAALAGAISAEADKATLRERYENAERLGATAEGRDKAIAEYRAVVEAHLANEKPFQTALQRLAEQYRESGRVEEGIRFFVDLAETKGRAQSEAALREVFAAFRLKYPEVLRKVLVDKGLASGPQSRVIPPESSKDLAQGILQRRDNELREKSLARLRQMLAQDAADAEKRTALATLASSLSANFDRRSFLPLVEPLVKSQDWQLRMLALQCLPGLGATAQDLPGIVRLAEDPSPEVRKGVASALVAIGKGEEQPTVAPALLKLLRDPDEKVVEQNLRSMWGQYSTAELDAVLIDLSRDPRLHHNAIYFGLSTMRSKSVAVCRRLVEELDDPDWNNSGRAAWGLSYGVADAAKALVEEGLLRALPEETNTYTREQEFRALRKVAGEKSRPYLKSIVESSAETEAFKRLAREALGDLEAKR